LAVFLPQTSLEQLPAFLARVVRRLHDPARTRKGLGQKVAVGLCAFPEARGTAEQLLERCLRRPRPSAEYIQLSHPLSPRWAELM
jgi:hypothetical protein